MHFMDRAKKILGLAAKVLVYGFVFFIFLSLLPIFQPHSTRAPKVKAKIEMIALVQAIESYNAAYGHMPVSAAVQPAAHSGSFTYGAMIPNPKALGPIGTLVGGQVVMNSELIAVLMCITNYPGQPRHAAINTNYCLNPQQTKFLNASFVADGSLPGVGPDLVYRDPWGTPYVITISLSETNPCLDAFYGNQHFGQDQSSKLGGSSGPTNSIGTGENEGLFQLRGHVMVWSAGPDKTVNASTPLDQAENQDNVVSWR